MLLNASTTAPFTHIVSVDNISKEQFGYYSYKTQIGDIHPKTINIGDTKFNVLNVTSFEPATITNVNLPSNSPIVTLYLGRSDERKLYGVVTGFDYDLGSISYEFSQTMVFTSADVGKEIPIWLSTTPPHTNSKKTSMEESVDAQQGIIDDGWGSNQWDSYPKLLRRRRRVYSTKERTYGGDSILCWSIRKYAHRNNSCKYRGSASIRIPRIFHRKRVRYGGFELQHRDIYGVRKPCIGKYSSNVKLITPQEALYA